jgi:two-component system, LytTR family, sensor kinase
MISLMTVTAATQSLPRSGQELGTRRLTGRNAWLAGFAVWTLLALLSALQTVVFLSSINEQFSWWPILLRRMADWYTCAIFTPFYFWMVRRSPIDRAHWKVSVPLFIVSTTVFVVLKYIMFLQLQRWMAPQSQIRSLSETLAGSFIFETIAFWCVIGVVHALVFYERFRDREVQAAELKARLSASQLDSLVAQLHPHFLFNTLQGISTLIHRDPQAADSMLNRLSELLRRTMNRGERQLVTLAEETELVGHYVGIMQVRFGDRLGFELNLEPGTAAALVPHFILQPLVENAIQHGIARRAGAGRVTVRAARVGESLVLSVSDDGPGLRQGGQEFPSGGIGLNNTRQRLEQLYGNDQRLTLGPVEGGGLRVELAIPWREAA